MVGPGYGRPLNGLLQVLMNNHAATLLRLHLYSVVVSIDFLEALSHALPQLDVLTLLCCDVKPHVQCSSQLAFPIVRVLHTTLNDLHKITRLEPCQDDTYHVQRLFPRLQYLQLLTTSSGDDPVVLVPTLETLSFTASALNKQQ